MPDTIYALSSGAVPSGVAVIRVSGTGTKGIVSSLCGRIPESRKATVCKLKDPRNGDVLDEAL